MDEYIPYSDKWRAGIMHHTKQEIVMLLGTALAEKNKQIAVLVNELKSLTEAYNNTDWKKLTDEQKEIINELTVRWGKAERQIAVLREAKAEYFLPAQQKKSMRWRKKSIRTIKT